MGRLTAAGLIAALTLGTSVLVASAQPAPYWPATTGTPVVTEWYSDLPWHQKLGTTDGNEIDTAIVLPYAALGVAQQVYCRAKNLSQAACMIETGIVNILGTLRTDTPYNPQDEKIKNAPECQSWACVHRSQIGVVQLFDQIAGVKVELQARKFGTEPPKAPYGANYGGYVITDGSTYAPQMPWYMAHYCDSRSQIEHQRRPGSRLLRRLLFPDEQRVQSLASHGPNEMAEVGALVGVSICAESPNNHCSPGQTACTLVMAGFNLDPVPSTYTNLQYWKYNNFLLTWFNRALANFPNNFSPADLQRHFPWSGNPVSWENFLYPQAVNNPFLGTFQFKQTNPPEPATGCDVTLTGPVPSNCTNTANQRAITYLYPRQCMLADLAAANVAKLRQCGLNYELHHNGYLDQWPQSFWSAVNAAGMLGNQYGRTSFLFAGIPGMQMPVIVLQRPHQCEWPQHL